MSAFDIITAQIHTLKRKNRDAENTNITKLEKAKKEVPAMIAEAVALKAKAK